MAVRSPRLRIALRDRGIVGEDEIRGANRAPAEAVEVAREEPTQRPLRTRTVVDRLPAPHDFVGAVEDENSRDPGPAGEQPSHSARRNRVTPERDVRDVCARENVGEARAKARQRAHEAAEPRRTGKRLVREGRTVARNLDRAEAAILRAATEWRRDHELPTDAADRLGLSAKVLVPEVSNAQAAGPRTRQERDVVDQHVREAHWERNPAVGAAQAACLVTCRAFESRPASRSAG